MSNQSTAHRKSELVRSKKAILFLAVVFVSMAMLEFGSFAIWRRFAPDTTKRNVEGLTNQGGFEVQKLPNTFWHHEFNPQHIKYKDQLNSYGTKGPEFAMPKPDSELRIVAVGDSTVEGTGVAANETFPYYLEEILKDNIHLIPQYSSVQVINGGIGSQNSAFNLAYLEFRLLHFNPDIIVVKSSYNDYLPYVIPGMTYDYTHAFPNPYHQQVTSSSLYWALARYSYFLKLLGVILFRDEVAIPFRDFSGHVTRDQFQEMDFSGNADKFFVYAENIRSMILLSRGRGMKVILVDLPTSPDSNHFGTDKTFGIRFKDLIMRLELELEGIAEEEHVPLVRTGPFEKEDFWDHVHNTSSGNRKIAESIAKELLNLLIQSKKEALKAVK